MKKYVFYGWKSILVVTVVLVMLVSAVQAFGAEPDSQDVTLSATVREPSGTSGTVKFTFELEKMSAASAVMPNYSSVSPEPSAIPEPAMLVLVGLGVLGLMVWRKATVSKIQ